LHFCSRMNHVFHFEFLVIVLAHGPPKMPIYLKRNPHIFGFPLLLLVPSAPLSSAVTSVSEVSALRLTGSPSIDGLVFSFSSAFCLSVFLSPSPLAPVSSGVGFESAVSALRDTGSPIWVGFSFAISLRDLLSYWYISGYAGRTDLQWVIFTEGAIVQGSAKITTV
jgi:hypothetical protein